MLFSVHLSLLFVSTIDLMWSGFSEDTAVDVCGLCCTFMHETHTLPQRQCSRADTNCRSRNLQMMNVYVTGNCCSRTCVVVTAVSPGTVEQQLLWVFEGA